jgi:4-hydroxy-tetrahydrodipicolinate synthase
MKTMYGVITAMTTPFFADGEVDFEALGQQTEFLIQSGVNCLYPCGTTGEMLFMTLQQRKAVAEAVVKQTQDGRSRSSRPARCCEEDTVELARHACEIGADGVGIVTPSFYGLTADEMTNYYIRVARRPADDFSIYLYKHSAMHDQRHHAGGLRADCGRLPERRRHQIQLLRHAQVLDYLRVRDGDFSVLIGFDRLLFPGLTIGCGGNGFRRVRGLPEPFVAGYRAYQKGDRKEAERQMWIADDVVKLLKAGASLATFKAGQDLRGLPGGHVHAPLCDLSGAQKKELQEKIQKYLDAYPR